MSRCCDATTRWSVAWLVVLLLVSAGARAEPTVAEVSTPDAAATARALLEQGQRDVQRGRYAAALAAMDQALTASADQPALMPAVLNAQGWALTLVRRYEAAEQALQQAGRLAAAQQDPALEAAVLNNLGNLQVMTLRPAEATVSYTDSAARAQQAGDAVGHARALANAAALASRLSQPDVAALLDRASAALAALPPSREAAAVAINLGTTLASRGQVRQAHDTLQLAQRQAREAGDPRLESSATGAMAQLYLDAGRHDEALTLARQAAFLAQASASPDLLYRWQWLTGRCHWARQDLDAATAAHQAAVATLESIKSDVVLGFGNHEPGATFRTTTGPLYYALADLLLRRAATAENEPRDALLLQARDATELLKSAELADYFQDQCVARLQEKARKVDDVAADTAVIYIIPLPDRIELLLSLSDGLHQVRCDVGEKALAEQVRQLREAVEDRTSFDFLAPARQLYTWLIAPIDSMLQQRGVTTLVFVPDGALRTVPMSVLHDGKKFLVERYATAVSPGLTLMDPQPIRRGRLDLLMAGLSQSVQGFPALDYVPQELDNLQQMYGGTKLINEQFRVPAFEQQVEEESFAVVHIASHGKFGNNARDTFLLTYDDRLTLDGLERLIRPTQFRGQPVELLSLSACQTAVGDDRAALGLAGIAVKSGARSALATLWFVNDQASSQLVGDFYKHLQQDPTLSKAQALRRAQQALLVDPRYRHPCYWAPFLIIGNWL